MNEITRKSDATATGEDAGAAETAAAETAGKTSRFTAGFVAAWLIGVVVTALYASVVVAGVGNLILLPQMSAAMGLGISLAGWFWLVFGIVFPVLVYALALVIARKRAAAMRVLVLATGLCLVAAVQLEVVLLVPQSSYFAS